LPDFGFSFYFELKPLGIVAFNIVLCIIIYYVVCVRADAVELLQKVLRKMKEDELMQLNTKKTVKYASYAAKISSSLGSTDRSDHDKHFAEWLVSNLHKPIGDPPCKKDLWSGFHQIRSTPEFFATWREYLKKYDLENEPAFC